MSSGSGKMPKKKQEMKTSWESAMVFLVSGLGFMVVSIVLAFQPMGMGWWFWLLIPGFGGLGVGLGQAIALRQKERKEVRSSGEVSSRQVAGRTHEALPTNRTVFADEEVRIPEHRGDLSPHSVTENTTRHLELDKEGETTKFRNEE